MGNIKVHGLITRQTDFGDNDRIFTILTSELGTIRAMAKGVRQRKSSLSVCRLFLYGEFMLYEGRNLYYINSVNMLHDFFELAKDIESFSLACYLADLAEHVLMERAGDASLIRLMLNSFYLMEQKKYPPQHIKTVFELRLARCAGFMPDVEQCSVCHGSDDLCYFSIAEGHVRCQKCGTADSYMKISPDIQKALLYILKAPDTRAFSFQMAPDLLEALNNISEQYVAYYCRCDGTTLDYYHHVASLFAQK